MHLGARSIPFEYYVLRVLEPAVDQLSEYVVLGYLGDRPIFATVTDSGGGRYHYAGLVPRLADGRYDVESLSPDEWIVEPGLIYRSEGASVRSSRGVVSSRLVA
jgi:hypothetical protein